MDKYTGLTTFYSTARSLKLNTADHFFIGIDNQKPTLSSVATTVSLINPYNNSFLDQFYPLNGTVSWRDGFKDETFTLYRDMIRDMQHGDVESIIWICAWVGVAACSLIFAVAFCNCRRNLKLEEARREEIIKFGDLNMNFKTEEQLQEDAGLYRASLSKYN